jgi:hypothetical protein
MLADMDGSWQSRAYLGSIAFASSEVIIGSLAATPPDDGYWAVGDEGLAAARCR